MKHTPYILIFILFLHSAPTLYSADLVPVVIPAAGYGTRMLPCTKVFPKELFPLLEKPIIHEIVEEGLRSDLTDFIFIMKAHKEAIADYFDATPDLEHSLAQKNKSYLLSSLNKVQKRAHCSFVRQPEQLGLGHAVLMAKPWIHQKYFAVFLPDVLIFDELDVTKKLVDIIQREQADAIIAVEQIPDAEIPFRGMMKIKEKLADRVYEISGMVEKPKIDETPSRFAVGGRYVFSREIFECIEATEPDASGEIQLTEAINQLLRRGKRVVIYEITGKSQDTGRPLPWLEANIQYALRQPEYAASVKEMLRDALQQAE